MKTPLVIVMLVLDAVTAKQRLLKIAAEHPDVVLSCAKVLSTMRGQIETAAQFDESRLRIDRILHCYVAFTDGVTDKPNHLRRQLRRAGNVSA